ncbi:hypothetical protein PJP10_32970, partial [Mycobacterium kansasii]
GESTHNESPGPIAQTSPKIHAFELIAELEVHVIKGEFGKFSLEKNHEALVLSSLEPDNKSLG